MKGLEKRMPSYTEVVALLGWFPSPAAYKRAVSRGFTNPHMFKRPNETKAQRFERQRNMMAWNDTVTWAWMNETKTIDPTLIDPAVLGFLKDI